MSSNNKLPFDPERDLPDLTGKVVIVTGGNGGVGLQTVRVLASKGANVYMASRSESKAKAAIDSLGELKGKVKFLDIDLSDSKKVKKAADEFLTLESRLDVLVNNAALLNDHGKIELTPDGITQTMAANVLGPLEFTRALLPLLKKTATEANSDVRVINVGSDAHTLTKSTNFATKADWNNEFKSFISLMPPSFARYAYSKLGVHLWTNALCRDVDENLKGSSGRITLVMANPGAVFSDGTAASLKTLPPGISTLSLKVLPLFMKDSAHGAYSSLFAAASPEIFAERQKYHGSYIQVHDVPKGQSAKVLKQSKVALDPAKQKEFMDCAEGILKERKVEE